LRGLFRSVTCPRQSRGLDKTVNRSKRIENREPPEGSSYQPFPDFGNIPEWSLRSGQPLKHNSCELKKSDPQNADSSRLPLQPRSHFCPLYTQPLPIPNTSPESRPPCEHDPLSAFLLPLHSLSAMPISEGLVPVPFEVVHLEFSSGISGSIPGWYFGYHLVWCKLL
jgi:hypothetical protein